MTKGERKFIYIILILIILLSGVLIYMINKEPKYDQQIYNKVYEEYAELFDNETNIFLDVDKNNIVKENNVVENKKEDKKSDLVIGKIEISKLNISYPVLKQTTSEYLKIAPTKLWGNEIGKKGNFCIIGHNYKNNDFFSRLHEIEVNDKVFFSNADGIGLIYKVYDKYNVSSTDLSCTSQNTDNIELTLITCTDDKNERLVVKCIAMK